MKIRVNRQIGDRFNVSNQVAEWVASECQAQGIEFEVTRRSGNVNIAFVEGALVHSVRGGNWGQSETNEPELRARIADTANKLRTKVYTDCVVVAYDGPFGERGKILSRHTSHDLADKAARNVGGNWARIAADYGQARGEIYDANRVHAE